MIRGTAGAHPGALRCSFEADAEDAAPVGPSVYAVR